jgi:hypothetical protein
VTSNLLEARFWIIGHAHDSGSRANSKTDNSSYSEAKPSIPIHDCARSCRFFL